MIVTRTQNFNFIKVIVKKKNLIRIVHQVHFSFKFSSFRLDQQSEIMFELITNNVYLMGADISISFTVSDFGTLVRL